MHHSDRLIKKKCIRSNQVWAVKGGCLAGEIRFQLVLGFVTVYLLVYSMLADDLKLSSDDEETPTVGNTHLPILLIISLSVVLA